MKTHKGFATIPALLIALGIVVIGGGAYVAVKHQQKVDIEAAPGDHREEEQAGDVQGEGEIFISWQFTDAGERNHIPYTKVMVFVNGMGQDMGEFEGSCTEIGASGGVDGKGLLAGELSAAQCWFAGGGDEIGVFAHEDGGVDIMVGKLEESIEGSSGLRGNFNIKNTLKF